MNRETCPELGGLFKLSSRHPILAWNSKAVLPTCLESLSGEIFRDFEVILVVNGSQDEAPDDLKEKYAMLNLCVERLDANRGFASANNLGARLACGQWLSLLNTDAFPEPDWLEKLLRAEQYAKHIPVPRTGGLRTSASTLANQLPIPGGIVSRGYYLNQLHNYPIRSTPARQQFSSSVT